MNGIVANSLRRLVTEHKSFLFFFIVLISLLLEPLTVKWVWLAILLDLFFMGAFVIVPYLITRKKRVAFAILGMVMLAFIFDIVNPERAANPVFYAQQATNILIGIFITGVFFWYILRANFLTRDHVFGGITAYFLMALIFAKAFQMVQDISAGAFYSPNFPETGVVPRDDLLHLSFSTLTTVGYGDVIPVSRFAKRLCNIEACLGVLYVAIFIGRLIGLELTEKKKRG